MGEQVRRQLVKYPVKVCWKVDRAAQLCRSCWQTWRAYIKMRYLDKTVITVVGG